MGIRRLQKVGGLPSPVGVAYHIGALCTDGARLMMIRFMIFLEGLFIIYLFYFIIFGCVGSSLRHVGSFLVARGLFLVARRLLSSCGVQAPEHVGSVVCGTQAL